MESVEGTGVKDTAANQVQGHQYRQNDSQSQDGSEGVAISYTKKL